MNAACELIDERHELGLWRIDFQTLTVTWSLGMYRIHGATSEALTPTIPIMRKAYPELFRALSAWIVHPATTDGERFSQTVQFTRPDGFVIPLLVSARPRLSDGNIISVSGLTHDLTVLEHHQSATVASDAPFQALVHHSPNGLIQATPNRRIILVNQAVCDILGFSSEELLAMTTDELTHPEDQAKSVEAVTRLFAGEIEHCSYQKRYLRRDGSFIWVQLSVSLFRGVDGTPLNFIGQFQDISQHKQFEEELHTRLNLAEQERLSLQRHNEMLMDLTITDSLTLLRNRSGFERALSSEKAASIPRQYSIVSIDIGSLALRNRNHGSQAVDELLCSVARALTRACSNAHCVARISGGAFRILLSPSNEQQSQSTLRAIERELAAIRWRRGPISPTVSHEVFDEGSYQKRRAPALLTLTPC